MPVLTRWVNGEIVATPPDDSMATHTTKITKEMGQIDWSKPANEITISLGLNPAPGCYTYLDGKRLKVWSGEVVPVILTHCLIDVHSKHVPIAISATTVPGTIVSKIAGLGVFCGDGNIILLTEVQPENKKRISAIDFINGHQIKGRYRFWGLNIKQYETYPLYLILSTITCALLTAVLAFLMYILEPGLLQLHPFASIISSVVISILIAIIWILCLSLIVATRYYRGYILLF